MARVVKIKTTSTILLNIVTNFEDGTPSAKKTIAVGDTVTGLRWIENEAVHTVTGIVTDITYSGLTANANKANPTDTFAKDLVLGNLVVDASTEYHSDIVTLPIMEIVEDAGVENVANVRVLPEIKVILDIEYTNGVTETRDLQVGDLLDNVVLMSGTPGTPDITGRFKIASFIYALNKGVLNVTGLNLVNNNGNVKTTWDKIIKFTEIPHANVSGVGLGAVSALLATDEPEVSVVFDDDVVVPDRDDGKITAVIVPEGKTLNVDLNGKTLDVAAYAFYSTGGTIVIDDSTGNGVIKTRSHKTYGALYSKNGKIIINGGKIDCRTETDDDPNDPNYMYGIVASGSAVVEMNGGEVITSAASCASITNGTAEGVGATFVFGGDSKLTAEKIYAIYLADNKTVLVKDNAVVEGICARMGHIIVQDNAVIHNNLTEDMLDDFGGYLANYNGVWAERDAILIMAGMYSSNTGTNEVVVDIKDNGKVIADIGNGIAVAKVSSKYDQNVDVVVANTNNITVPDEYYKIRVYEFEECAEIAAASGKTITKTNEVNLTITENGTKTYPVNDNNG